MSKFQIQITGEQQTFNYSVSQDVATQVIRLLNEAVFPEWGTAQVPQNSKTPEISPTYQPLYLYLASKKERQLRLRFQELEKIIGAPLRPSARKHKAWWANTLSHVQATAWLEADYKTREVDLENETVLFQKK